jgi:lipopolysaccharide/colanic/teichoic acid biosynthesis glycosyltransferase
MGSLAGRLPGLLDVIMGRIRLVGVRPLAKKELPLYEEEWTLLREQAPCGLFTPIDAEGLNDSLEEEKIVAENYYSATRSFTSDVRIFFRGVLKLLVKI